jgi:protein-tyrosine phosphatase
VVELPDGVRVRARAMGRHAPGSLLPGVARPDHGVYLLGRQPEPPPWSWTWIRWPDFRAPADGSAAVAALVDAHRRAGEELVEVACRGGRGRTGTALAALAVLAGVNAADAVRWVRDRYHPRAVETGWQRRWVERIELG